MIHSELIEKARSALQYSRADYSHFLVGAALLCRDGKVFSGCNIESASYGLTVCAERVALWKALSEGASDFVKLAIVVDSSTPAAPCGACRQVLYEYAPDLVIISAGNSGEAKTFTLKELLPEAFTKKDLNQ